MRTSVEQSIFNKIELETLREILSKTEMPSEDFKKGIQETSGIMNNIPEEIINRAVFAASGKGYCTDWATRKIVIAGLEGAGVAGMLARIAELEKEAASIRRKTIEECRKVAQERVETMRQKVETEKNKESSLSVDYYQGRVNEGQVIEAHIGRLHISKNVTPESLFMDSLSEKTPVGKREDGRVFEGE